jgi:hypothetical protein
MISEFEVPVFQVDLCGYLITGSIRNIEKSNIYLAAKKLSISFSYSD